MQGELSKQEAAALEALKESRAHKLAALLSENKLQALQQKKAVEEALAQASGACCPPGCTLEASAARCGPSGKLGNGMTRVYSHDTGASSSDCLLLQLTTSIQSMW